mgnify:CR=1 FL=1
MIKTIVIIGGGTSGWTTTLNFLRNTDNPKIINISSNEVPSIGVGESTTGTMNDIINSKKNIEIDELDFLKNTNSTFKLGINHIDWRKNESFVNPLGDEFLNSTKRPSDDYDYYRIYHVAKNNMKYEQTQGQFMLHNKLQFLNVPENDEYKPVFNNQSGKLDFAFHHIAYHLDTFKVGDYLKEQVLKHDRVSHIEDLIVNANRDENGLVTSVKTKSGQVIEGDLFVDCTGFFRMLIKFDNEFISWENNLLTNRAIAFPTKDYKITNHTTAKARKYGWEWNIPLQHRMGRGYVFNDRMISVDQAVEEIEKDYGPIDVVNDVKFTPGRMKKAWHKNVISAGLSNGFVEPLEATAIHMTIIQIELFLKDYYTDHLDFKNESQHKNYNRAIGDTWDDIRDFINVHYVNTRQDTDFWKMSSNSDRWSPRLKELLETWQTRMPRYADYSSSNYMNFYKLGNTLWYQVLLGMKILNPDVAEKELRSFNLWEIAQNDYEKRCKFNKHVINLGIDSDYFYKKDLNTLYDYKSIGRT